MYYFLNHHTSPQAALHLRAYIEHSKEVPTASNMNESASNYCVLVGASFSRENIWEACAAEIASTFSRDRDLAGASIALLKG